MSDVTARENSTLPPLRVASKLGSFFLVLSFLWPCMPETLAGEIYVGPAPIHFVFFYIAAAFILIGTVSERRNSSSLLLWVAATVGVYMTARGLLQQHSFEFLVIDTTNFCGILLGLVWARQRTAKEIAHAIYWTSWALLLLLLLNIAGLVTGIFDVASDGNVRRYNYGMFEAVRILLILTPGLFLLVPDALPPERRLAARRLAQGVTVAVLLAAILSATRSILIIWTLNLILVTWLTLDGRNLMRRLTGLLFASLVLQLAMGFLSNLDVTLLDRLQMTEIEEEARIVELQMMFEHLNGKYLTGDGFGSRFESCVTVGDVTLAYAPHIALFTLWLKGGAVVFALLICVPLGWSLLRQLRAVGKTRHSVTQRVVTSSLAMAFVYLCSSGLSGGWSYSSLFHYGASLMTAHAWSQAHDLSSSIVSRVSTTGRSAVYVST